MWSKLIKGFQIGKEELEDWNDGMKYGVKDKDGSVVGKLSDTTRGIELIMDGCKTAGLPEPTFEVNPPFVNLTIRFKESLGGLNGTLNTTSGNNGTINGTLKQQNGTLNGTSEQENGTSTKEDVTLGLTDTEKRMLEAIRNNPKYTLSQLAQIIGKSRRMVARYVSAL